MTTFCQFKPCDEATFGHKNLKTVTHFAKMETFALSTKAARSKTTPSFFFCLAASVRKV